MAHNKDMRRLVRLALDQGWSVDHTTRGHWRFIPPDRSIPAVVTSGTPGDVRAFRNFKADLKRKGFRFDGLRGFGVILSGGRQS